LALLIDRKPRLAGLCALGCAFLSLFGFMHSVLPSGEIYLPWAIAMHAHYWIASAYMLLAGIFMFVTKRGHA
jgi:adenine/guanine/hypoxanthine permease